MEKFSFIKQYITKPRFIGAILPSSKYLANRMVEDINFEHAKYIVEYGPGTGVFTEMLIKKRNNDTVILLLEYNKEFYKLLKEKFKNEPNLHIINDSAEYIDKYLIQYNIPYLDYIVSGLPFTSLPQKVSSTILYKTQIYLKEGGKFFTFQYTLLKKDFIQQYFKNIYIKREFLNFPPAYVFCCSH